MELTFITPDRTTEHLTEWMGAPPPTDVTVHFEKESVTKTRAVAEGVVDFRQRHEFDDNFQHFVAVKGPNNKLICRPAKLYRMMPCFNKFMTQFDEDEKEKLSRREQLDELKTKFGSKRTQRQNAQKRKYEIQFGEEDVDDLPTLNSNNEGSNPVSPSEKPIEEPKEDENEEKILSAILPKRNEKAEKIEGVYNFRDMITDAEYEDISANHEKLAGLMKCDFVKRFCDVEKSDIDSIVQSIYADILIQLLKLSAHDMKKDDPMPHIESDIKKYIFERYTTTELSGRRMRYVITPVNKDRINAYAIIILFMLSKYKPIDMEILKNNFKYPIAKLRKLVEVIGAYFETASTVSKGASIKVAKLKLPLNMPKENKKFKR